MTSRDLVQESSEDAQICTLNFTRSSCLHLKAQTLAVVVNAMAITWQVEWPEPDSIFSGAKIQLLRESSSATDGGELKEHEHQYIHTLSVHNQQCLQRLEREHHIQQTKLLSSRG